MRIRKINSIRKGEQGFTVLESLIACAVLLVGVTGLMALFAVAVIKNNNQGTQATRTTEYAQDKMEELMALSFNDTTSDTRFIQTCLVTNTTAPCTGVAGSGLGGDTACTYYPGTTATICSAASPNAPSNMTIGTCANALYCDYVFEAGTNLTDTTYVSASSTANGGGAQYMRQWQIYVDTTTQVKTITVIVSALQSNEVAIGSKVSLLPNTMLISQKTNY